MDEEPSWPQFAGLLHRVETLAQGLTLFSQVGMPARNLSRRTRQEYENDLRDMVAFLTQRGVHQLRAIGLLHLEAYQADLDRRGYKASTQERKLYAIKAFFRFLHRHGLTATNVAAQLIPPDVAKSEPRYLTEQEYRALLAACAEQPRDRAIIELFLQTGVYLSELARLTVHDIDLPAQILPEAEQTGTVRVTRNGGAVDTIPLNCKACRALREWLQVRPRSGQSSLFLTRAGHALSKRTVQNMIQKYLQTAGIPNASVQTLRHTMATHHALKGTDVKTLQKTLEHVERETTKRYYRLAKKEQRRALQDHAL